MSEMFSKVCDDCPLRLKVDVDRAEDNFSLGTRGTTASLRDGARKHDLILAPGEVLNSDTAREDIQRVKAAIETCHGPETTLLQSKCAVGLANAFRWTKTVEVGKSNVSDYTDIKPHLRVATAEEAMEPGFYWYVGPAESYVGVDLHHSSSFSNTGIYGLSKKITGERAELPKDSILLFDSIYSGDFKGVHRIR